MKYQAITPDWPENCERLLGFNPRKIVENLSTDLETLRHETLARRSLDENWSYTFHPLWLHPLVRLDGTGRIFCPIPGLLARRITEGLYFDVADHDVDALSEHMGPAFQRYVGEAIGRANLGYFKIYEEEKYGPKKSTKDTVD